MRRRVVSIPLSPPPAQPEYPEYDQVRAEATRRSAGPIDPRILPQMEIVAARRGNTWCSIIIGRAFAGVSRVPTVDAYMLLVADELKVDPPVPQRIAAARQLLEDQRSRDRARVEQKREEERRRWELALSTCPVEITVRPNLKRQGAGRDMPHAVAAVPVRSSRGVHPAGRALCEHKRSPRQLGEPIDGGVVACQSCVRYVAEIRPMDAPRAPTPAERALLQLMASGVVFTLRHLRAGVAVRVTTDRNKGRAGGLGRSVNAAALRLQAKGWAAPDEAQSGTPTGTFGHRWRLTEAGTAELEG
ncbi:hypothetical protein ACFCZR_24530 [Streptomyces rubiginosohelvolus]|uniref:hypothetical protein n=1 Tax=Streptomyces rubiginosohelvolus TaxID=67362 RepID=UPI0035D6DECB